MFYANVSSVLELLKFCGKAGEYILFCFLTIHCNITPCMHCECRSKFKDNYRLSGGLYNLQISAKSRACVQASHNFLMSQVPILNKNKVLHSNTKVFCSPVIFDLYS